MFKDIHLKGENIKIKSGTINKGVKINSGTIKNIEYDPNQEKNVQIKSARINTKIVFTGKGSSNLKYWNLRSHNTRNAGAGDTSSNKKNTASEQCKLKENYQDDYYYESYCEVTYNGMVSYSGNHVIKGGTLKIENDGTIKIENTKLYCYDIATPNNPQSHMLTFGDVGYNTMDPIKAGTRGCQLDKNKKYFIGEVIGDITSNGNWELTDLKLKFENKEINNKEINNAILKDATITNATITNAHLINATATANKPITLNNATINNAIFEEYFRINRPIHLYP